MHSKGKKKVYLVQVQIVEIR